MSDSPTREDEAGATARAERAPLERQALAFVVVVEAVDPEVTYDALSAAVASIDVGIDTQYLSDPRTVPGAAHYTVSSLEIDTVDPNGVELRAVTQAIRP